MKTALLIIDVQAYFLRHAPADLPTNILEHIDRNHYDCLAFTVFHNPPGSNWERSLQWTKCRDESDLVLPDVFNGHVTKSNVFRKSFYSALKIAPLKLYLKEHNIERLTICGIDSDACVLATAYDAFDQGYSVEILPDLCFSRAGLDVAAIKIINRNLQDKTIKP